MKKLRCSGPGCGEKPPWYDPYRPPREPRWVEVPDEHEGKAYCCFTCAIMDGAMSVRYMESCCCHHFDSLPEPEEGDEGTCKHCKTSYRYDGKRWNKIDDYLETT
jgi:hypothetical protein